MKRLAVYFGFTLGLLWPTFAQAQSVGPNGFTPIPGDKNPDPEVLRRLAAQLGQGQNQSIPDLAKLVEQFGRGGKIDQAGLKAQLEKLTDPDKQKLLERLLKDYGGQLPKDFKLPTELKGPANSKLPRDFLPPPPLPSLPDPNRPNRPSPPEFPQRFDRPGLDPPAANPLTPPNGPAVPNTAAAREAIEMWEKNIGSLNDTPAVRDALIALATSGLDSLGEDGKPFWEDLLKDSALDAGGGGGSNGGFLRWLQRNTSGWSLPSGGSNWSPPGSGWGSPGGSGMGTPSAEGLGAVGIVFVSLLGLALVAVFIWKVLPALQEGRRPRPLPGQGPWPVNPREIRTRVQLVQAFEYLSVLECGDRAKAWNHVAMADGLRAAVPDSTTYADELADLYALARYLPEAEPITDATIAQARGYLCRLAGVSAS